MKKNLVFILLTVFLTSCIVDGGVSDCPKVPRNIQLQKDEVIISIVPSPIIADYVFFKFILVIDTVTIYNQKEKAYYSINYSINDKTCELENIDQSHGVPRSKIFLHPDTIYQTK